MPESPEPYLARGIGASRVHNRWMTLILIFFRGEGIGERKRELLHGWSVHLDESFWLPVLDRG